MYVRPDEVARTRAAMVVTTKHESILRLIDTLLQEGRAFLLSQEVDSNDRGSIARLLFLVRMLNHLEAISRLSEFGFETEVRILHRSMLEAFLRVAAISRSPETVDDYWTQYLLQRKGMFKNLLEFLGEGREGSPITPAEVEALLQQVLDDIAVVEERRGRKLVELKTPEWARKGQVEDLYFLRYRISSFPVHHSPHDMARHLELAGDGESAEALIIGPEMEGLAEMLRDSADLMSMALAITEEAVGTIRTAALAAAATSVRELYR